jgi:hypothetical protein
VAGIGRSIRPFHRSGFCLPQSLRGSIVAQVFGFDKSWLSRVFEAEVEPAINPKGFAIRLAPLSTFVR